MTRMQLAGCYQVARSRRCITKLIPTIKCATASVIEANRVEVMHVWGKRMLHPPGTHDFKTVQPETTRILSEVPCLHFSQGKHWVVSSAQLPPPSVGTHGTSNEDRGLRSIFSL